jgi:DNA polymerase III alpha subunit
MKQNTRGELVFQENDLCDLIMQGRDITAMTELILDSTVNIERVVSVVEDPGTLITWTFENPHVMSVPDWDAVKQKNWYMPIEYKNLDIAEHVLSLCCSDAELQRVGNELLLFQERGLFDLLKYLKYLVDVLRNNNVIWGVGRGSSVASYVLYLLGVHRIDSLYYDLDPSEFLR